MSTNKASYGAWRRSMRRFRRGRVRLCLKLLWQALIGVELDIWTMTAIHDVAELSVKVTENPYRRGHLWCDELLDLHRLWLEGMKIDQETFREQQRNP